jgi:membrane protein
MAKRGNKYLRKILYWRPVRTLLHYSRLVVLPGFQGIPLFDVAIFFIKGLAKGAINQRASSAAFRFVLRDSATEINRRLWLGFGFEYAFGVACLR